MVWLPYIIGGVVGAVVLFLVFDWALIFLSTLTGATLIVQMAAFNPWFEIFLFLALVIAGMAFQAKTMTADRRVQ
jgi:NADH:ubiquinone oxidoreductase subunit 3 (subunit A)